MKKIILIISSILILMLGIFLIYLFLNSKEKDVLDEIFSREVKIKNVEKYDEDGNFKSFSLNDINYKEYSSINNDLKISIWDYTLTINDIEIESINYLFSIYAIYDDQLLVMVYRNDLRENKILEYNLKNGEYAFITDINGDNLFISDYLTFNKFGINIISTKIKDGFLLLNKSKKNICDIDKYDDAVAFENIIYYSDDTKLLETTEVVKNIYLNEYIKENDICR